MERNTLMAQVYPKLKDYCREKHGLEFQVKRCVLRAVGIDCVSMIQIGSGHAMGRQR